jgi:Family of unknown function (DUF5330)
MRIFRTLFILTAAVLLIPSPPEDGIGMAGAGPSTPEMLGAAFSTVADLKGFCERQPGVCTTAGFVVGKLEAKAKHGVKLIYDWANDGGSASEEVEASDAIQTGSTSKAGAPSAEPKQSTLTLEDLIPEWRGPKPKPRKV